MKILIIKNDGFGDLTMVIHMLNSICHIKKATIQIILSKGSEPLGKYLRHFNKIFLSKTGIKLKDNNKIIISEYDNKIIKNIKKKNFDVAIILRRYLNFEHVFLMNAINAKHKYSCYQFIQSNNLLKYLKKNPLCNWNNILIPENKVNDLDYYEYFLKKIKFLESNYKFSSFLTNSNAKKSGLVINLSGEKSFYNKENFEFLINNASYLFKEKITIIGKTFQKTTEKKIKNVLKKINNKKIINFYNKSDFKKSMQLINNSKMYIGFDTGLSHYAVNAKKRSLIILGSGPGFKWFPYPIKKRFNETYWLHNTPCGGCNNSAVEEACFFKRRICVDNIFSNKNKIITNLKAFFTTEKEIINYSNYKYFISDWTMPKSNLQLQTFSKNFKLIKAKDIFYSKYLFFFYEYIIFLLKNNLLIYFFLNIISRSLNKFLKLAKC